MNLTILGGIFKGLPWPFPEYRDLRPTSVMLRRRVFDKFQNLNNRKFIDLCCGTGLMGVEALSRGCEEVYLVEKDKKKLRDLNNLFQSSSTFRNLSYLPQLVQSDCLVFLKSQLQKNSEFFDDAVLYFDPPYELAELYEQFFQFLLLMLSNKTIQLQNSIILIEFDTLKNKASKTWTFKEFENFGLSVSFLKQAQTSLAILQK
jgi:16S rRNA (guanine966-N2)-methyltransferase